MPDLTLIHYTDNSMPEEVAKRIREYALEVTQNKYPVVSVSQKPIDFGKNKCVGEIGKSKFNLYMQVLEAAKMAETEYVAALEDDTLYSPEHFEHRPPDDTFLYDTNYWFVQDWKDFYWRIDNLKERGDGMWGCIAKTKLMVDNLTQRFKTYPEDPFKDPDHKPLVWGEPGLNDRPYGMQSKCVKVHSKKPSVVFLHKDSIGFVQWSRYHRRYGEPAGENRLYNLEQFGSMRQIYDRFWKEENVDK